MKQSTKLLSIFCLVVILGVAVFSLSACNDKNAIVGTWVFDSLIDTKGNVVQTVDKYTFYDDGTVTAFRDSIKTSLYWNYDKADKCWRMAKDKETFNEEAKKRSLSIITIEGEILTITAESHVITYKKA
jgi:hypothetical protein